MDRRNRLYYLLIGAQFGVAVGAALSWGVYLLLRFF